MLRVPFHSAAETTFPGASRSSTLYLQNAGFQSGISQVASYAQQWIPSDPSHAVFPTQSQQILRVPLLSLPFQPVQQPQSKFILIIDDSQTVRKIVETCLRRENFKTRSFEDGVEAMRWLAQHPSHAPDLIILDIVLPRLDGYEVARRLKAKPQLNNTVVIMLTRRNGVMDRLKGHLAGAKDYLTKPFKTQELLAIIESHLGRPAQEAF